MAYLIQFLFIICLSSLSFASSVPLDINKAKNGKNNTGQYKNLSSPIERITLFDNEEYISSYINNKTHNSSKNEVIEITKNSNQTDQFLTQDEIKIIAKNKSYLNPNSTGLPTYLHSNATSFFDGNVLINNKNSIKIDRLNRIHTLDKATRSTFKTPNSFPPTQNFNSIVK